jgi:diguanylate cyclase (GGDEF)-like protein
VTGASGASPADIGVASGDATIPPNISPFRVMATPDTPTHAASGVSRGSPSLSFRPLVSASFAAGAIAIAAWAFATSRSDLLLATALVAPAVLLVGSWLSRRASREDRRLALTDRLTGLGNDRHFTGELEGALTAALGRWQPLTICLIDVDDFKGVNDRFGHQAGDRVLAGVAGSLRGDGEAFRIGGDEFALLLPGCDEARGELIASTVLERIASAQCSHGERVTASAGVATFLRHTLDRRELLPLADSALYCAKSAGKNRARSYRRDLDPAPRLHESLPRPPAASGVGELVARVSSRMGFTSEHVELIRLAASLNDIGKVALPEELLAKPGPLTADERRALERHPQIGYRILDSLGADPVATWVLHHHERWDGSGYPGRLAGEHIPLGSRILFVADAYEAMTTDQAWRERLPSDAALAELRRCAGTQFDPRVVEAFVAELESSAVAA